MVAKRDTVPAEVCASLYDGGKGKSVRQIADQLGVSVTLVRARLQEIGAVSFDESKGRSPVSTEKCVELYDGGEGMPLSKIAEELGCSRPTVITRLRSANVYVENRCSRPDVTAGKIRALAKLGHGIFDVADLLDTNTNTIQSRVNIREVWPHRKPDRADLTPECIAAQRTIYYQNELASMRGCATKTILHREQRAVEYGMTVALAPGAVIVNKPHKHGVRQCHRMALPPKPSHFLAYRLSGTFDADEIGRALKCPKARAVYLIVEGSADDFRPSRSLVPASVQPSKSRGR